MLTDDPRRLLGQWNLRREIHDRLTDTRMLVAGRATFVALDPDLIEWRETGVLHHASGDLPVEATRRLRRSGSGEWTVEFADGREFHAWHWGRELIHACAPDDYRGRLSAGPAASQTWRLRWAATGPSKDNVIESSYERADGNLPTPVGNSGETVPASSAARPTQSA